MVTQLVITPATAPLRGSVPGPLDAVQASLALGLAAISGGACRLRGAPLPQAVAALADGLRAFGVSISTEGGETLIEGRGLLGLRPSSHLIDTRGLPLTACILAGLTVSSAFEVQLIVDEEWGANLAAVLSAAHDVRVEAWPEGGSLLTFAAFSPAPGAMGAAARPHGIQRRVPGAQVGLKAALLFAGLRAGEPTVVQENIASPDTCERLLHQCRIPVEVSATTVRLHPPRDVDAIAPFSAELASDPSAAAYLLAAASLVPGSHVTVRRVALNPTRAAYFDGLRLLGVRAGISPQGDVCGEPVGEVSAYGAAEPPAAPENGWSLGGELAVRLGDDMFPVALAGVGASGNVELCDVLSGGGVWGGAGGRDVARLVGVLNAFGVTAAPTAEGFVIAGQGVRPLRATRLTTGGDHRLALAASVLALRADGVSVVDDVDCLARFFPRWVGTLRALGATVEVKSDV